jgi:hypothetical protein
VGSGDVLADGDRDPLYERLSAHAAVGTFDLDELERRVAAISAAHTRAEADAVIADLPALPADTATDPTRRPRPGWGRGHGEAQSPQGDWRATSERFRDPKSGRVMRVWEDAGGGRHYVPDDRR